MSTTLSRQDRTGTAIAAPSLVRQISGRLGVGPTFECQICFDTVPLVDGFRLEACRHVFCRECITSYVRIAVSSRNVALQCHFQKENEEGCGAEFTIADIRRLSDPDTWRKYQLFSDKNTSECPKCHAVVHKTGRSADLTCQECNTEFCFFHSLAHAANGMSCATYQHRQHRLEIINRRLDKSNNLRKCPGCGILIEYIGGCQHQSCPCGTHFCQLCGRAVGGGTFPYHYAWWNVCGCPGRQLVENARPFFGAELLCYRVSVLLVALVVFPIALAFGLVFGVVCCPCLAIMHVGRKSDNELPSFPGAVIGCTTCCGYGIIALIGCLLSPVIACVLPIIKACTATCRARSVAAAERERAQIVAENDRMAAAAKAMEEGDAPATESASSTGGGSGITTRGPVSVSEVDSP